MAVDHISVHNIWTSRIGGQHTRIVKLNFTICHPKLGNAFQIIITCQYFPFLKDSSLKSKFQSFCSLNHFIKTTYLNSHVKDTLKSH